MSKDFKVIRDSINSLRELGLPTLIISHLEAWLAEKLVKDKIANCDHKWLDVTNKHMKDIAWCPKCGALESLSNVTIA